VRFEVARRCLLLALILSASAASAQPATVVVRGRIVADADDRPLRRAAVKIAGGDQPDREMRAALAVARGERPDRELRAVLTDEEGRFEIELPESSSQLIVTKAGYTSIVVIPDRRRLSARDLARELDIRLSPGAAVWGRVLERSGAPAVGARVVARRVEDPSNAATTYEAETDDSGEYRIGGLPAGTYIMATGSSPQVVSLTPGVVPNREVVQGIVSRRRLIFPGMTPGLRGPTRLVDVRAGEETGDLDFESAPDPLMITPPRAASGDLLTINDQETGAIVGRVVTPLGQPVSNALVHISGSNGTRMVVADANGQFEAGSLRDGDYRIQSGRLGFFVPDPNTQPDAGTARMLHLGGDTRVHDIELVLARAGAIAGAIVDGAGEPFQGVLVRALRLQSVGERTVATLATQPRLTDDRGRYRLFGLPPGSYVIVASIDAAEPAAGRSRAPGFSPVYYPGTAHVESAQQVQVELGSAIAGVDWTVAVTSAVRVTGTALNSSGNPLPGRVSLGVSHRSGSVAPEPRFALIGDKGEFELADVPPGDYVLQALGDPGPGTPREFGAEYVAVADHDPPPLSIKTSAGATLDGRFVAEGRTSLPMRAQVIHAAPLDVDRSPPGGRGPDGLAVHDDGRFYLTGLFGLMRLTYPASPGWYLKSVTIGGVDVTDLPFDFGSGDETFPDAEIMLSSAGASIAGSITDGPGPRSTASTVVAFSVNRSNWFAGSRHLKRASSSSNGSFDVNGLPPGEYFIAAVDTVGPGDWQTPNTLEALVQGATRVTVREGQAQTVSLRLLRR
jgi:hypothetical protein